MEHVMVRDGKVVGRLEATRAVQYEKRAQTLLEDVYFREYDRDGAVLTEVWADRAVWHTDTEDAEASGDIYLYSHRQEAEVLASSLAWTKGDRVLSAGPDDRVYLRKDDGSELEGTGFWADFRRSVIRLKAARGVYVYDEEGEESATAPEGASRGPDESAL
jgi:LPS export ABC transporter protein LptC